MARRDDSATDFPTDVNGFHREGEADGPLTTSGRWSMQEQAAGAVVRYSATPRLRFRPIAAGPPASQVRMICNQ